MTGGCATRCSSPGRTVVAGYDKIHLYDAFGFRESDTVSPGRDRVVISGSGHAGRARNVLRRALPRAVRRSGPARRDSDRRACLLGIGTRQGRAVGVARSRASSRQRVVDHRGGTGLPAGLRAGLGRRTRTGSGVRWSPRRTAAWQECSARHPISWSSDIDADTALSLRTAIPVLDNRVYAPSAPDRLSATSRSDRFGDCARFGGYAN